MKKVQYELMSWKEIEKAATESGGVAILPIGAVEEHGPHNPVGVDTIETYAIGLYAARQTGAVILPSLWYGNSRSLMDFPGSIGIRPEIMKEYAGDVLRSLIQHQFTRPILLDGHSGNYGALDILVEDIMLSAGVKAVHVRAWDLASLPKPAETPVYDGHGGLSETSAMLYLVPESVDREAMIDCAPEVNLTRLGSAFPTPSALLGKGPAVFPMMMGELTRDGHHGDPRLATAERGKRLIEAKGEALAELIRSLQKSKITWRNFRREEG